MADYNAGELLQLLRDQRALIERDERMLEKDKRDRECLRQKAIELVSQDPNWRQFIQKYLESRAA